jgi:hypothetical protein
MTTRQPSTARTRSRSASASTSTIPPTQPNQNRIRTTESIQESDDENQGETETEGEEENAAEGLVLMHGSKSEAVTTEMVEVRVLDARGHVSQIYYDASSSARIKGGCSVYKYEYGMWRTKHVEGDKAEGKRTGVWSRE